MNSGLPKFIFAWVVVWTLCLPAGLQAQNGNGDLESEEAALDLLKVFDEATEIATKSKLNADYVPGMVTVLHGKDLQARGIETVWEALALVPGVQVFINSSGTRTVVIRGVGRTFGSGNVKILLNGITVNSVFLATAYPVFDIPVSVIDRIEMIRGPGSAVHGEFAYNGVINVVTRRGSNEVFFRAGSYDSYSGAGILSWANPENDLKINLNMAGLNTSGADVTSGIDKLFGTANQGVSNAPGPANEDRESYSLGMVLDYRNFSFETQYLKEGHGEYFGSGNVLPPPEDRIVHNHSHLLLEARQKIEITSTLQGQFKVGWMYYSFESDRGMSLPPGSVFYPNGIFSSTNYRETRINGGGSLTWTGWDGHKILLGFDLSKTKLKDAFNIANFVPSTLAALPGFQRFEGSENFIEEGRERFRTSLTLQDEINYNADLTFTLGLRYDHYDDVGDRLTPRAAGVYRLDEHHILKLQYAQAFRPPTFLEMFSKNNPTVTGNPNIKPAVIDTFEGGYIYKKAGIVFRSTFFYSVLQDLIEVQGGQYVNSGGATQMGMELEWEQEVTSQLKLNSNLTLVDTKDQDTGEDVGGSAHLLANVGINYRPWQEVMFNLQYRYVGSRHRETTDSRAKLGGYNNVDLTANWFKPFGGRGWTLRGGIRNLFDEDIFYPAQASTYPGDYPRPGIHFWGQLSYEF